jgi:hypothetical protein
LGGFDSPGDYATFKFPPTSRHDRLDKVKVNIALVRHIAAFRPGEVTTPTASAKTAMRAIAKRWLFLHEEV